MRAAFLLTLLVVSGMSAGRVILPIETATAEETYQAEAIRFDSPIDGIGGDVNCSGALDLGDALGLRRSVAGLLPNPSCIVLAADVTCDHNVDATDVLAVLRALAGLPLDESQSCSAAGAPIYDLPTSSDLIDAALAAEEIDEATAHVYRVFAAYGDSRLPGEFAGANFSEPSSLDVALAMEAYSTLSPEQQAMIAPYILPPSAAGSWYDAPPGLAPASPISNLVSTLVSIQGTDGVRIWHDISFPAEVVTQFAALTSQIATTSKASFARFPLNDIAAPNHGPDGALDLYLVSGLNAPALLKWLETGVCKNAPVAIEVNADVLPSTIDQHSGGFAGLVQTVSHAFAQATSAGVNTPGAPDACVLGKAFKWAIDATGGLLEDIAFPSVNSEHRWDEVFETPHLSMHEFEEGGQSLWMLLEHLKETNPNVVSAMWTQAEAQPTALGALAASVDLEAAFPEFAMELLNSGSNNHFNVIHNITRQVFGNIGMPGGGGIAAIAVTLAGQTSKLISPALTMMEDFSAQHYRFTLADPEIKSVGIGNLLHGVSGTVTKILGRNGPNALWQIVDITSKAVETICLADPGRMLTDIMVVMSRPETEDHSAVPLADEPILEARSSCGYTGTLLYTRDEICPNSGPQIECIGDSQAGNFNYRMTSSDLVFAQASTPVPNQELFLLTSGTVNITSTGNIGDCPIYGSDTVVLPVEKGGLRIRYNEDGTYDYALYGYFDGPQSTFTVRFDCGQGEQTFDRQLGFWLCSGGAKPTGSPETMSGSHHFESTDMFAQMPCPGTTTALPPPSSSNLAPQAIPLQIRDYSWTIRR